LELLPLLQNYNSGIVEALQRTAQIAGDDIAHLEKEAGQIWPKVADKQGDVIVLDKKALLKLPVSVQRYLLRQAVETAAGNLKDIEARHIEEMMQAMDKPASKQISLPYGLVFAVDYERYLLAKDISSLNPFPALEQEYPIIVPGTSEIPGWCIDAHIIPPAELNTGDNPLIAHFDYSRIAGKLTVRARQRGDRFQPLGMNETKKVAQFMMDAKIPKGWRSRIPVIAAADGIIWVAGHRIDERVKVTKQTKKVLCLEFRQV
jgi:tRNA(Ile)-lysidine synthase